MSRDKSQMLKIIRLFALLVLILHINLTQYTPLQKLYINKSSSSQYHLQLVYSFYNSVYWVSLMYKITVEHESKDVAKKLWVPHPLLFISLHRLLSLLLPLSAFIFLCLSLSPSVCLSHPIFISGPQSLPLPLAVQVTLAQAGRLPLWEGGPLDDKKQEGNLGAVMILFLCVCINCSLKLLICYKTNLLVCNISHEHIYTLYCTWDPCALCSINTQCSCAMCIVSEQYIVDLFVFIYIWQSQVEIECYSVAYFDCITAFKVL